MKKIEDKSENYTNQLEEKIVELRLQLKAVSNTLKTVNIENDRLISMLIHNLKNPIGISYSFSDMILAGIENYDAEKIQKHVQIIKNSSQYTIELLNSFSEYNQLKNSSTDYNFQLKNYNEVLNNVVNDFNEIAKSKKIGLIKKISEDPLLVNIDARKITRALKNILNNAIRFSDENSKIIIEVVKNNNTIDTVISDEGIGVSENDLTEIFKDFVVINTYDKSKQKCIGLGLPIAEKIIKQHSGKISAKSILNMGTSVTISLPLNN